MTDKYRLDSHKLMLHPKRVAEWLEQGDVYPLTIELSPSGSCNHRCQFCAFDYLGYEPGFLELDMLRKNLQQMGQCGVKSIVLAGEGEPLLHPDIAEIASLVTANGMDAAMASNGVLFTPERAAQLLPHLTWIRFSVNAGTAKTHHAIHQGQADDFTKVLTNLRAAVALKKQHGWRTTLGVQMLLMPENCDEVLAFAKELKEIGVDYFSVKPYSQHPKSVNKLKQNMQYRELLDLEPELTALSDDGYQVIFRSHAMKKLGCERRYSRCWGLPFWAYVDAKANVWACLAYVGETDFCFGNMAEQDFTTLWQGEKRRKVMDKVAKLDLEQCRENCRLDEINAYLEKLKNPSGHSNFI